MSSAEFCGSDSRFERSHPEEDPEAEQMSAVGRDAHPDDAADLGPPGRQGPLMTKRASKLFDDHSDGEPQ
eukprot:3913290-Amphidinium_carterae.2